MFEIPNYNLIMLPATCSSHSGLAIYLHDSYQFSQVNFNYTKHLWEGLLMEISGNGLKKKISLANIYRPPRDRNNDVSIFL